MIILLGGEKGGTGKTTLAINLAAMRSHDTGNKVLLVDTDIQESANFWAITRNNIDEGENISRIACAKKYNRDVLNVDELQNEETYKDIVIDAGGRNSVELRACMTIADALFVPVQPFQIDLWTLARMEELVKSALPVNPNLKSYVIINQASPNPVVAETEDTKKVLEDFEYLDFSGIVVRRRISYARAAGLGLSVLELKPHDKKAIEEMRTFYKKAYSHEYEIQS